MLINIVKMYKLWQFRIPSSLSQRFVNHLKVYKNNLESPVLPKLFHDVRSYCYTRSHENGKKMEILLEHIEQMKSSLNIDRNKLIVPTFTNVKKIGGVRSRRNNAAFECSLSVKLPSELSSMRCMGRGLTKELAKKSAINIFIRASSVSNRKLNTDNETIKRSSIRNQHIIQKGYSLTGVNALRDLHGQTSRSPARIQERLLKFKNTPSITSTDTHRYYSQNAAEFKEKEEKTVSSDVCVADRHTFQEILKAYPAPRNRLSNFFNSLEQSLGQNNLIKMSSKQLVDCNSWEYRYKLAWPMTAEFIGKAATKKEAARNAALKALHWLKVLGKIDLKGNLYTIDKKEFVKQETKKAIAVIKLKEDFIEETESLVEEFDQEFSVRLHETCSQWNEMDKPSYFDTGVPRFEDLEAPQSVLDRRNNELLDALSRRKRQGSSLPITDYGSVIVNLVRDNSVLVIKGEPGCGKSTQVPQMIFDDCTERLEGTKCNIVVTQPRKISAISIAERIAQERNEQIGDVVGYQVRFASKLPRFRDGNIVFCTLGIMLRKLLSPDGMRGITHLIIDEAHERDLNTDIMLLLAKRAIENNPNLRIIIMSATINPELFQNYFNNAPSLHVPGFTHPVKSNFLDNNMEKALRLTVDDLKKGVDQPGVNPQLITKMVNWVDANRPPGAILVFLPGWDTIRKVRDELEGYRGLFVVPVHSRLSHDDQRKIFMQPPRSMRKVVLATNIAETSITINDVIYVIDSGLLKEKRLSSKDGLSSLDNNWASKASVIQRKGRAGRVQPGECFHLYTKEKYETFDKFPMPEVHRIRLETVVLQSKTYSGHEKAEEFLSQLPEPPNVMVIREAVKTLQFIGALDEDEDLTPLGHRISIFTTHPLISKALVYSYFFKCVNPLVTIGTIFSSEMELFPGMAFDKSRIRDGKCRFSPSSDHIALAWLFQQWAEYLATNEYKAKQLMEDILGSHQNFLFVKRLQELVADHLRQCQLTPRTGALFAKKSDCNAYVFNDELIKGVFLSGVGNLLISRKYTLKKGVIKKTPSLVTQEGHKSIIAGESVNHRRTEFPSPLIAYFQEMHSAQNGIAMIRDTSIVSPVTVALFQPGTLSVIKPKGFDVDASEDVNLQLKSKITFNFACDERTATALVKLREAMWSVIDYFVMECGNPNDLTFYREVNGFHKKVLNLLNRVLLEEGTRLDYDENGNLRKAPGKKYP